MLVMLCDPFSLVLAGDTAQSVEEGVVFRFDEVRQLFSRLGGGDSALVPRKPHKLTINFRSHSGILDVAALVLERLSTVYPLAIDSLPRDHGLCKGPRPMLLTLRRAEELRAVLGNSEGASVPVSVALSHSLRTLRVHRCGGGDFRRAC